MNDESIWPETGARAACNGGGGCVIAERVAGMVILRDSKNPYQPGLVFSRKEYADFRRRVIGDSWPRLTLQLLGRLTRLTLEYLQYLAR
jgi:hypothetical protein